MITAAYNTKPLPGIEIVKENIDSILKTTTACVYWKDKKGRYLGVNDTFVKVTGISSCDDVIGRRDQDLWYNEASALEKNDQSIIYSGASKIFIESALCGKDKKLERIVSNKTPLKISSGKIIGIFGISFLLEEIKSIVPSTENPNDTHLTQRQIDCLIHLVKGKTMKQIAYTLNLSSKTVEHYLDAIKSKLGAKDRSEVIEKALQFTAIRERL